MFSHRLSLEDRSPPRSLCTAAMALCSSFGGVLVLRMLLGLSQDHGRNSGVLYGIYKEKHGKTMGKRGKTMGKHGKTMGKPWENVGKPWENNGKTMGKHGKSMGKAWENVGKPWENNGKTMGKPWGKAWEKHGKTWENVGKPWEKHENIGKTWENHGKNMGKHGKTWENHGKNMGKHGKTMRIYGKTMGKQWVKKTDNHAWNRDWMWLVTVKTGWVLSSWLMGDIYWLFLNLKFKVSDLWCVDLHFHSLGSIMQFWRGCCRACSRPILCFFSWTTPEKANRQPPNHQQTICWCPLVFEN